MIRIAITAALAVVPLALAACTPHSADGSTASATSTPAVHPVSGLKIIPLTVTHAGQPHTFRVEVAATPGQQEQGLMFRTAMGADEGMIFPMEPPRGASFWMRNTVIPLDLVYVGTDGRISNIAANAVPYSETPLLSAGLVKGVLELNGGRAAQLGIVAGDKVSW